MQRNHISMTPAWAAHELERAEKMVRQDFPDVRQDLVAVAVRLSQREVSPRDGVANLLARARHMLEKRQALAQ
jgi:hypothetical protein